MATGDPFLDNVLVHADSGEFSAWVDWEDASTGPALFDLACCAVGSCFRDTDNSLDMDRLTYTFCPE